MNGNREAGKGSPRRGLLMDDKTVARLSNEVSTAEASLAVLVIKMNQCKFINALLNNKMIQ
jgi:hypothetical protein